MVVFSPDVLEQRILLSVEMTVWLRVEHHLAVHVLLARRELIRIDSVAKRDRGVTVDGASTLLQPLQVLVIDFEHAFDAIDA